MDDVEIKESHAHGHVKAVLTAMDEMGITNLIFPIRNYLSDLLIGMVVARVLWPDSKFYSLQNWELSSLNEVLHLQNVDEVDLYNAIDWFYEERLEIAETELINRHKESVDSAIFYISQCHFTMDRYLETQSGDQIEVKKCINYGVLIDGEGCPIYITYFKGDKLNTKALLSTIEDLQTQHHFSTFVLITNEDMLSQVQFNTLKNKLSVETTDTDVGWVAALKLSHIKSLVDTKTISLSMLEENKPLRVEYRDFDKETLFAWKDHKLAERYQKDRNLLLRITTDELNKIQRKVAKGLLNDDKRIKRLADQIISKYKMTGYINHGMLGDQFQFSINQEKIDEDKAFDGLSMIRVFSNNALSFETAKRYYKRHQQIRESFQTIRITNLEDFNDLQKQKGRINGHLFISLLASYVKWHMLEAWRPLIAEKKDTYTDNNQSVTFTPGINEQNRNTQQPEELTQQNFQFLLDNLGAITGYSYVNQEVAVNADPIIVNAQYTPKQNMAFDLLKKIKKY